MDVGLIGKRGILLLLLWALPVAASAQTSPPISPAPQPKPAGQAAPTSSLPVDIDLNKIRSALLKDPPVRFDDIPIKFYVEIQGQQRRFWDLIGDFDLKNGPVPGAGMTHQEFLNQVAPKNIYFGQFSVAEAAKILALSAGGNYVIKKLVDALKHAPNDKEAARIRAQIDRELAALAGK